VQDSLSDSGWERRKRDLSAGEFLAGFGWRGAPALVLSVRGGWGRNELELRERGGMIRSFWTIPGMRRIC